MPDDARTIISQLLPGASAAVRDIYEKTLSMPTEDVQKLAGLLGASAADRSTYMSTEAWQFGDKIFAIPGNDVCADCGSSEMLTWASLVLNSAYGVVLCNECCGGHRALGTHLSQPLSIKMDKWSEEKRDTLLATGNASLNRVFEAHEKADALKPGRGADVALKHAYIRAKYENRAFCADGDGVLVQPRKAPSCHKTSSVATAQVNAGIAIIRVLRATDLVASDLNGKSDPYVKIYCGAASTKTKVLPETLNPVWNETLQLNVPAVTEPLWLKVKDEDKIGSNDPLGDVTISLAELTPNEAKELTLPLKNVEKGQLVVEVTWCPLDR